jgi:hypothetical protein
VLIDYRYHLGSFVVVFVALLLGILIGIGLAPNPEELNRVVADLKVEYREAREAKEAELQALRETNREYDMLAREAVSALVRDRLSGRRIAVILDHELGGDGLAEDLRGLLKQAGASITSTTVITHDFVALPTEVRQKVAQRLSLYPPPGVHFRTLIAQAIAKDLANGQPELIRELHATGLLRSSADSDYKVAPEAALLVGGQDTASDASPERIDLPMIQELTTLGIRVVGCEPRDAPVSCISIYRASGIPTVDNADTAAGRLALVLALAGADGHFGVKETADRFLPDIPSSPGR